MSTEIVGYDTQARPLITQVEYQAFQEAYDFFNGALFGDSLPQVLVTLQRKARKGGYFSPERFDGRLADTAVHEIALNPDVFVGKSDADILAILVHEQVHAWQQTYGKIPRRGYHDRQWGAKMKDVGLYPSNTGAPGGKETGQQMGHYISADGAYARAYAQLHATGFCLHWQSKPREAQGRTKNASKTKYTCPACGLNAWAKPAAPLICGDCERTMEEA